MADAVDIATEVTELHVAASLAALPSPTPPMAGGDCETCELPSPKLFAGQCAWCHDGRERPESAQPEPTFTIRPAAPPVEEGVAPEPPAAPATMSRLPTAPGRKLREPTIAPRGERRQLNVHFPADRYDEIARLAEAAGQAPSAWARTVFMAHLDGQHPPFEPGRKPFISAEVIRAARAAGQPLDVFVTALIARGLATIANEGARQHG